MLIEGLIDIGLAAILFFLVRFAAKRVKMGKAEKTFFGFFNILVFFFALTFINKLSFAGDEITLTATREVGSQSNSNEVFLNYFVIDGIEQPVTQLVQGKWYFKGEGIYWNDDTAHTELVGETDSVVIRMPVGISRQMYFDVSDYRGFVQINDGDETYYVDTSVTEYVNLNSSPAWKIAGNYAVRALLTAALLLAGWLAGLFILKRYPKTNGGLYHLTAIPVCMLAFLFMWYNGDKQSFWIDELYQIAYVSGTLGDVLNTSVNSISDPPIYNILAWVWYQLVPHTEKWLLLLPELITVISIYLMGYFGCRHRGVRFGVILLLLTASAGQIYIQLAFENRQYALWFLMCVLAFEAHWNFVEHKTYKALWLYTLTLILTVLTQYLSIFLCFAFFLCDMAEGRREKERRLLIPYLIGLIGALPFAGIVLAKYIRTHSASGVSFLQFWADAPNMNKIVDVLLYLMRDNVFWLFLLAFGCAHIILRIAAGKAKWQERILLEVPILFFTLNYFYSVFLNRAGSIWVARYFTMVLPQIIMICGLEVEYLIWHWGGKSQNAAKAVLIGMAIFFGVQCWDDVAAKVSSTREPYREAADWLYDQTAQIYKDTTLVIDCESASSSRAWYTLYLTKEGLRDDINVISFEALDLSALLQYEKVYVVQLHSGFEENRQLEQLLSLYYKKGSGKSSLDIREYTKKN